MLALGAFAVDKLVHGVINWLVLYEAVHDLEQGLALMRRTLLGNSFIAPNFAGLVLHRLESRETHEG